MKADNRIWSLLFCLTLGIGTAGAAQEAATGGAPKADAPAAKQSQPAEPAPESAAQAPQTAEPAPAEQAQSEPEELPTGDVARSTFATEVENREPVDQIDSATADTDTIYFFTELKDLEGQQATHRWEHDSQVMAEVDFNVGGPSWRVWSTKKMLPTWTGQWTVSVINGSGEVIETKQFEYKPAPQAPEGGMAESKPTESAAEPKADVAETGADIKTGPDTDAEQAE